MNKSADNQHKKILRTGYPRTSIIIIDTISVVIIQVEGQDFMKFVFSHVLVTKSHVILTKACFQQLSTIAWRW